MKRVFFLISVAALLFAGNAALAQESKTPDAKKVFNGLNDKIKSLKSYKLIFEYTEYLTDKKKEEWRKCEFWFMGRDFMRLEVLDGTDKGSKVAYNAKRSKDKAHAKAGYMPFPIAVSKDDERLSGFFESDWESDIKGIAGDAKDGSFSYAGEEDIKGRTAHKIEITPKKAEYSKILLWIDKKDSILLQYENFKDGKFNSRKTFYNIELNPDMNPKTFVP